MPVKKSTKDTMLHIRIASEELEAIKKTALEKGFDSYSEYCLSVIRAALGRDDVTTREVLESLLKRVAALETQSNVPA